MYTYNKNIAHVMSSNYKILYFSLSQNNDLLNQDKPVEEGKTLVQIVFAVEDIQKVLSAYVFIDTDELSLREENCQAQYVPEGISEDDIQQAVESVTWFIPFYSAHDEHAEDHSQEINTPTENVLQHFDLNEGENAEVSFNEIEIQEYVYSV